MEGEAWGWVVRDSMGGAEEKKLELRLGPPGGEEETQVVFQQQKGKENIERNSGNGSQTRTSSVPVVGWPPVGTFRKNIAGGTSSKVWNESQNVDLKDGVKLENCKKSLFVKINMDGIPIGRKIDLKAYDSYEKLSSAVEKLFQEFPAAQRDLTVAGIHDSSKENKAFTGLLDGNGDYALVYEDNEGDKMLVGDVPWLMFVSTVKRLRVMKTSELSALYTAKREHHSADAEERQEPQILLVKSISVTSHAEMRLEALMFLSFNYSKVLFVG
ncbi:hypothetical protein J5N97_004751 [Dioscorea zingiberensis]|uniref:Auxin-responsive protein n=1 Tax=Dioscorea zingiberensis TaxID=325984 RepID=A0A9D5D982_9LILI|nr:hypothetical protein J5N97_004751 [Dioscorea zingiberensis]